MDDGYESESPYASMYDDPARYSDPLGDEADEGNDCCKVLKQAFASVSGAVVGTIDITIQRAKKKDLKLSSISDIDILEKVTLN